ncbi:hypothetical protein BGX29_001307, partial [Mortierella sp. GBA35]
TKMSSIAFVCNDDGELLIMAAALFNKHKTQANLNAVSSGIYPLSGISDRVRKVLSEVGIDSSDIAPMVPADQIENETIKMLVLMEYGEGTSRCVEDDKTVQWVITAQLEYSLQAARVVRDELEKLVKDLIAENNY